MAKLFHILCVLIVLSGASACETLDDVLGEKDTQAPLPGNRVPILGFDSALKADASLDGLEVQIPPEAPLPDWSQTGGAPQGVIGNLALAAGLSVKESTTAGDGYGWESVLASPPIVAAGAIYVMDAKGYISAHDARDMDSRRWLSEAVVEEDEPDILGGGLAYEAGRIFATTGQGRIAAFSAASGQLLWQKQLGVPLRAAPRVVEGIMYVLSVDNQLFAFAAANGGALWSHRGISETAGFLGSVVPSVAGKTVIAPYNSGEIIALDTASGQELWSDVLTRNRRTAASAVFSGIGSNPVVADGVVYAASNSGILAANALRGGRRVWEQSLSSTNPLWLAGEFLYVLTTENELACIWRRDGRIKWVTPLPRFEDEEKKRDPIRWLGPVMAGNALILASNKGELARINPFNGQEGTRLDIPDDVITAPIVAGGILYLLDSSATLYALQ